jgi:hypothetical protein
MSLKAMKALLAELGKEAEKSIQRPAEPRVVMREFVRAMSVRVSRPIQLVFRAFPTDVPVSGLRLDCGDRSIVVVEERAVPHHQLVILGHELWHEEQGECSHHLAGVQAAARALADAQEPDAIRRAAEQILAAHEVPHEALVAVAARNKSDDLHEIEAETFGFLFGKEVRTWMAGPHARGPVSAATLEGRINLSMTSNGGSIL